MEENWNDIKRKKECDKIEKKNKKKKKGKGKNLKKK